MELAISGAAMGEAVPLEDILDLFNELDVHWIELWSCNLKGGDPNLVAWDRRYESRDVEGARRALESRGIGVACVNMLGSFSEELAARPDEYLGALKVAIDVASELGSKLVNNYCYYFAFGRDADIGPFVRVMKQAAAYASDRGITLLIENEAHDAAGTVAGMTTMMEAVGSPAFRMTLDASNFYRANEEGFPYAYHRLKQYIKYVHVKGMSLFDPEIHDEAGRGGELLGRGADDYVYYPPVPEAVVNADGLLAQLRADGYGGFCVLEPHVPADWAERYYRVEVPYLRERGVNG